MTDTKRKGDTDRGAGARRLGEAMRQKFEALETIETHAEAYRAHTEELERLREQLYTEIRRLHGARLLTTKELAEAAGLSVPRIKQIVSEQRSEARRCRPGPADTEGPHSPKQAIPGLANDTLRRVRHGTGSARK